MTNFDRTAFFDELIGACASSQYRVKLEAAAQARTPEDLVGLGNRIEAEHSVPTAIASFALTPESFETTIGNVILLGGDTDTLAAMAGALSGAYLGSSRLPTPLAGLLGEQSEGKGLHQATGRAVVRRLPRIAIVCITRSQCHQGRDLCASVFFRSGHHEPGVSIDPHSNHERTTTSLNLHCRLIEGFARRARYGRSHECGQRCNAGGRPADSDLAARLRADGWSRITIR